MEGPSGRQYRYTSCFCFGPESSLRENLCFFVEHPWFERASLLAVLSNCLILAAQGPPQRGELVEDQLQELCFTWLFTFELVCRIGAMGFHGHEHAFLSDGWNRLDFVVVLLSWLPLLYPNLENMTAIRAVRALRPLRTIKRLKGLQEQVNTLIDSFPHLLDIAILVGFVLGVYGVLGLQLFGGALQLRCYEVGSDIPLDPLKGVCARGGDRVLDSTAGTCLAGQVCANYGTNPLHGTVGFDNILMAWTTIFQVTTLEGWTDVLYMTSLSSGGAISNTYFVTLVILGAFYIPNLFLAVMWHIYSRNHSLTTMVSGQGRRALSMSGLAKSPSSPDHHPIGDRHYADTVQWLVHSAAFRVVTTALIVANILVMMCEHYPMDDHLAEVLEITNAAFVLIFVVEMLLKHLAFGAAVYWSDSFNCFDGVIVIISVLDVAVSLTFESENLQTQVLRAFRLLRIFRVLRAWTSLQRLLDALTSLAREFSYLMLLLGLILFVFALLGMQLFGGIYQPPHFPQLPRTNFESIGNAMITVFVIAMSESWNDIWVDTYRAVGGWPIFFFVALVVVANYLLLNLVVALLIGAFDDERHAADASLPTTSTLRDNSRRRRTPQREQEAAGGDSSESDDYDVEIDFDGPHGPNRDGYAVSLIPSAIEPCVPLCVYDWLARVEREKRSLGLFAREHPVRQAATDLLHFRFAGTSIGFDTVILGFILLSSITMGFESCDLDLESTFAHILYWVDAGVMVAFVFEMLTKIISMGLVLSPHAYLASSWNRLDAFIVLASLASLLLPHFAHTSSEAIRSIRLLRVLRPLRLLSFSEGMRTSVDLLLRALPRVLNVALVYLLFLAVFAILGVQLFAGRFGSCHDQPKIITHDECNAAGERWRTPSFGHFDHIGAASLLLFEMGSLEGWPNVMFAGIDAVGVGRAPSRDHAPWQSWYFVCWVIVGYLLLTNLIVGVLITTYNDIKRKEEEGNSLGVTLTEKQRAWVTVVNQLLAVSPKPRPPIPEAKWRVYCHELVSHPWLESIVLFVICFNTVLMGLDCYGLEPEHATTLTNLNHVCSLIFVLEAAIKMAAFGPRSYFAHAWNTFDFVVVCAAVLEMVLTLFAASMSEIDPALARVLRVLRIFRVLRTFRVIRAARGLKLLLGMLISSLPSLGNILGIYLVLTSMYALLAMQLFGRVRPGEHINKHANFCTFATAALTLFRCATGEAWNGIMHDAMVSEESGLCSEEAGDCGSWLAIPFFVTYVILSTFIIIKMMIVLIIENFTETLRRDQDSLQPESAEIFIETWSLFDPNATGRIHVRHLVPLLKQLPPPLGLDPQEFQSGHIRTSDVTRYAFQMDLRPRLSADGHPEVHFLELLAHLAKDGYKEAAETDVARMFQRRNASNRLNWLGRRSIPWEDVLPSPESKIGRELIAKLIASDIISNERASQRKDGGASLEHSVAAAVIGKVAQSWQKKRVKSRIQARVHAERFLADTKERTRARNRPTSNAAPGAAGGAPAGTSTVWDKGKLDMIMV